MLGYVTMLLLLIGGALSDYVDNSGSVKECMNRKGHLCVETQSISRFPLTEEEMRTVCSQGISLLKCFNDAEEECGLADGQKNFHEQMLLYLETELCNEDSQAFRIVSSNLECIEDSITRAARNCREERGNQIKERHNILENYLEGDSTRSGSNFLESCERFIYKFACMSLELEKECGEDVGKVFPEVAVHADYQIQDCPAEMVDRLPSAIAVLRSIDEVGNVIRRRRK